MAGLDQQFDVGAQEVRGHGDAAAVRKNGGRVVGEFLDVAEDVIPASGVQARGMLAQLIENFVHLESSQNRLDQNCGLDRSGFQTELFLRVEKYVIPEARLEVALQFGQIKIRACAARELLLGVVPEEK